MVRPGERLEPWIPLLVALAMAAVFAVDWLVPVGYTVWVAYLLPVSLTLFQKRTSVPLLVVLAALLLTGIGFFASPTGMMPRMALTNRIMGSVTLLVVALVARALIASRNELERQQWLREGHAELVHRLQGDLDVHAIAERAIVFVSTYLGARVGVLHVVGEDEVLRPEATYALPSGAEGASGPFAPGDGLPGQVWRQRATLRVADVPRNYRPIASGVGNADPVELLLAPASYDRQVMAVVELGFFRRVTGADQTFLEHVGEALAVALRSARSRSHIEQLLAESQQRAEELRTREREFTTLNEELVRQAEELDRTSRYKSEFLANMSHELRTPLNSSMILARLLADNPSGNLTPEQTRFAETIHAAGKDLLTLINDILDMSKVEAGKLEITPAEVPVRPIAEAQQAGFEIVAWQKGLAFVVEIAPGTPERIETDEARLQQILRNLLSNAFAFTERGRVTLRIAPDPRGLAFSVEDTGIGIRPEEQELVFEAFRRADGSHARSHGGTGLGLAISRNLARLLGGELTVASRFGGGSTFTLVLPPIVGRRPVPQLPEGSGPDLQRPQEQLAEEGFLDRTVLIAEDDVRNVFALTRLLEPKGIRVLIARDGREAIATLEHTLEVDVILMDVMMPEMDGIEAIRTIRSRAEWTSLPILALTAKATTHEREACIAAGASDYLAKPIDPEKLLSLLRVCLAS